MDRLSDLPDDLLIHILSFGPSCEAARTTALSRRWRRPLWLHTAAVNLDYRSYTPGAGADDRPLWRRAVDDAEHALFVQSSLGRGPKKVALVMRDGTMHDAVLRAACGREDVAAGFEELQIDCLEYGVPPYCIHAAPPRWTYYNLYLVSLPFAGLRLDAPRLRRFSYLQVHTFPTTSYLDWDTSFKFSSAPPDLEQVYLALHTASAAVDLRRSMLLAARHVRVLILTMYSLGDLAMYGLPLFHNLERLEIEELCGCIVDHSKAVRAIETLLRCCPAVRDLHLRFRWREYLAEASDPADQMAAMADLTPCRSINNTGYDDEEEDCCENLDLYYQHCGHGLDCLKASLKRVVVEFDAEELTCFQVRLIRFLAREAAGLEEVVINGGKEYDSSRMDRKVERWRRKWKRSPPRAAKPAPLWPPTRSEFPLPVKAAAPARATPPCSDVEVDNGLQFYDEEDEDEDEDDIFPRHLIRGGRKKKKGGALECFSVKLKAKDGMIMVRPRRGGANHRRRNGWDWFGEEEGGDIAGSSASPPPVSAISAPQRLPAMYEFPPLPCAPPPAPPILPSLSESPPLDPTPPSAPPCPPSQTAPLGLCSVRHEWRAVRLADLDVTVDMTSRRRYLSRRRRPLAPTMPSGRRCPAAFRIHQPL
uniref:F-box domain-containing protein n=1 Tax=Aegilops tauschii TaxID=37682 RepID=M8BS39_AEGTA